MPKAKLISLFFGLTLLFTTVGICGEAVYFRYFQSDEKIEDAKIIKIENQLKENPQTSSYLEIPFICQAPLQTVENWTLHENSCEEVATLMAYLYETGKTMTKAQANDEILKMIKWEEQNFGSHMDIYAEKVKELIHGFYGVAYQNIEVIKKASIENIKNEIRSGHPVIVPITGEILKNPYYPYPGYHMLTVIGFTEKTIITNDNGTRHGANYEYDYKTFAAAMNDAGGDIVIIKLPPKPPASNSDVK